MQEKNTDTTSDADSETIIYKRHKTTDVIKVLEQNRKMSDENERARVDYVLQVLKDGSGLLTTILLREPFDFLGLEQHLGIPEIADDSLAWSKSRRDMSGEAPPPATYVLQSEPKMQIQQTEDKPTPPLVRSRTL